MGRKANIGFAANVKMALCWVTTIFTAQGVIENDAAAARLSIADQFVCRHGIFHGLSFGFDMINFGK